MNQKTKKALKVFGNAEEQQLIGVWHLEKPFMEPYSSFWDNKTVHGIQLFVFHLIAVSYRLYI